MRVLLNESQKKIEFLAKTQGKKLIDRFLKDRSPTLKSIQQSYSTVADANEILEEILVDMAEWADPTGTSYKFLPWLVREYIKGSEFQWEDLGGKVKDVIQGFIRFKNNLSQKDINKWTFTDLQTKLDSFEDDSDIKLSNKQLEQKLIKNGEAEILLQTSKLKVIHVKTQLAAQTFGIGTKWCTAATESINYFEQYNDDGPLYIVYTPGGRYQLHFETRQLADESDNMVNLQRFASAFPEVFNLFKAEFNRSGVKHSSTGVQFLIDNPHRIRQITKDFFKDGGRSNPNHLNDLESLLKIIPSYFRYFAPEIKDSVQFATEAIYGDIDNILFIPKKYWNAQLVKSVINASPKHQLSTKHVKYLQQVIPPITPSLKSDPAWRELFSSYHGYGADRVWKFLLTIDIPIRLEILFEIIIDYGPVLWKYTSANLIRRHIKDIEYAYTNPKGKLYIEYSADASYRKPYTYFVDRVREVYPSYKFTSIPAVKDEYYLDKLQKLADYEHRKSPNTVRAAAQIKQDLDRGQFSSLYDIDVIEFSSKEITDLVQYAFKRASQKYTKRDAAATIINHIGTLAKRPYIADELKHSLIEDNPQGVQDLINIDGVISSKDYKLIFTAIRNGYPWAAHLIKDITPTIAKFVFKYVKKYAKKEISVPVNIIPVLSTKDKITYIRDFIFPQQEWGFSLSPADGKDLYTVEAFYELFKDNPKRIAVVQNLELLPLRDWVILVRKIPALLRYMNSNLKLDITSQLVKQESKMYLNAIDIWR